MFKEDTYPIFELRQVILNPDCLSCKAIPVKLSSGFTFDKWKRLLLMYIKDSHREWYEYVQTGKIDSITSELNLSNRTKNEIVNIMDTALKRLIIATSEGLASITVQDYLISDYSEHSGRGLLEHLYDCYGQHKVKYDIANLRPFKNASSLANKIKFAREVANIGFSMTDEDNEVLSILNDEQKKVFLESRNKRKEYLATLIFMNSVPQYYDKIERHFGNDDMLCIEQICEEVMDSSMDKDSWKR